MPGAYDRSRKSAVVRSISSNFSQALSSYFGTKTPNQEEAQGSHNAYVTALRAHGTEVTVLPELSAFPDSCFQTSKARHTRDPLIFRYRNKTIFFLRASLVRSPV